MPASSGAFARVATPAAVAAPEPEVLKVVAQPPAAEAAAPAKKQTVVVMLKRGNVCSTKEKGIILQHQSVKC